ncbi:MAG: hypothetical protein EAY81_12190, partial [Bacteroidetes bacterium]
LFVQQYRDRFNTEPSEAAFKGYDQLILLGYAVLERGKKFMEVVEGKKYPMLGTTYHFIKQKEGWYQNMYLHLLKFEEFGFKKVN